MQKKLLFLPFIACFFSNVCFAKGFETSISVSPAVSFLSNKSKDYIDNDAGFVFSCAIHEGYNFNDIIGIGTELEYLNTSHIFSNPSEIVGIPEDITTYNHKLKLHTLNVPLLLKIETRGDDSWFLKSGVGISILLYSKRRIELEITNINEPDYLEKIEIENEKTTLDIRNNYYYSVLLGKNIKIKKIRFFINVRYRSDIAKWKYELYDAQYNLETERYEISNRFMAFGFGIILNKVITQE